jgi:CheY-like chemotaxis protein
MWDTQQQKADLWPNCCGMLRLTSARRLSLVPKLTDRPGVRFKMNCVLLIDDNDAERRMYSRLLYYNGFDVLEADDPIVGLELARTQVPDVILMDYWMPRMNGLMAAEVLAVTPETAHIPIVCITGLDVTQQRAQAAGCRELLFKPMRTHELVQAVRRYLPKEEKAEESGNTAGAAD